jgi:hypothetical protein
MVGVGPLGLGVDGVLAWIPGANVLYSVGAGGLLLYEAVAAEASMITLAKMGLYLAADSATSAVPVFGWALDTLFPAHMLAARALQRDIEQRHGPSELGEWRLWRRARASRPA